VTLEPYHEGNYRINPITPGRHAQNYLATLAIQNATFNLNSKTFSIRVATKETFQEHSFHVKVKPMPLLSRAAAYVKEHKMSAWTAAGMALTSVVIVSLAYFACERDRQVKMK